MQRAGINYVEGACWNERVMGNTAITTSLLEKMPVQVCAEEHYCLEFHGWACSAAPINETKPLNEVEQQAVVQALKLAGGNVSQAAQRLGVSRTTIYNKLNKYSLTKI